jgi:hypothetical protein
VRDRCSDIAAILHHLSDATTPPPAAAFCRENIGEIRRAEAEHLRRTLKQHGTDPVLAALTKVVHAMQEADRQRRQLLAYAREFVTPRPYTLSDLANVADMAPSSVRGAYNSADVAAVADATGMKPKQRKLFSNQSAPTFDQLIAGLQLRSPDPQRVTGLAKMLVTKGWTPHPPQPRPGHARSTRRYIRWEQRWPGGTKASLYQEPAILTSARSIPHDSPRWFRIAYATETANTVARELDALSRRIRADKHTN